MFADQTIRLGANSYGKSRVRVMKVFREGARHTVREFSVDVALSGEFAAVHHGDNAACLPTDTMKNTVYVMAKGHRFEPIEAFAGELAQHFVDQHRPVQTAEVLVREVAWQRAQTAGGSCPHTFLHGGTELAECSVAIDRGGSTRIRAGLSGLVILNATASAFSGFARDRYTTLRETRDRIMCTSVTATWLYDEGFAPAECSEPRAAIRESLIRTFAEHRSESVQHTLYDMGRAALGAAPTVRSIRLSLPNRHCLLVDLSPFGLSNDNEVFVPTDEPHGLIEATIERG